MVLREHVVNANIAKPLQRVSPLQAVARSASVSTQRAEVAPRTLEHSDYVGHPHKLAEKAHFDENHRATWR